MKLHLFKTIVGNWCWNQYRMGIVDGKYLRGYWWRDALTGVHLNPPFPSFPEAPKRYYFVNTLQKLVFYSLTIS